MAFYSLKKWLTVSTVFTITALSATAAHASGFFYPFQSVSGLGTFYAGGAALADDASTVYENSAGMVRLEQPQFLISSVLIDVSNIFSGTGTTLFPAPGFPRTGNAQGGDSCMFPALYFTSPLTKKITFGLGVNGPYGIGSDFMETSPLRYVATHSSFITIDISPTLAYKFTDAFSFGAGLNFVRGIQSLENFVNTGIGDAFASTKSYGWGLGYNAGLLYQFSKKTRAGINFISQVPMVLKGDSNLFNVPGLGTVTSRSFSEPLRLPPLLKLSAYHEINNHWAVMGTAIFIRWNHLQSLPLQNIAAFVPVVPFTPATATVSVPLAWRNTWEGSVGVHYTVNPQWMLRAGIGAMQTPTNDTTREIRIPDNNKFTVALGARFQPTKDVHLDAGYARINLKHSIINVVDALGNGTNGIDKTIANTFGLQVTCNLG